MTRSLAQMLASYQRQEAGALDDPFAGVISEEAYLYATTSGPRSSSWGFDGTVGSSERVTVRRDGYSSAHVGACSTAPIEPIEEKLVRHAQLSQAEAELLRRMARDPAESQDRAATALNLTVRTYQRRVMAIKVKVRAAGLEAFLP